MSVHSKGDIYYPVFSINGKDLKIDGFDENIEDFKEAVFDKAAMPNSN
jgi:hypothetical protein